MSTPIVLLGISGSVRPGSQNTRLLNEAENLLPAGTKLVLSQALFDIPLTSVEDSPSDIPSAVKKFQAEIKSADGVIFSTPQFNYNIPTSLKVAITWAEKAGGHNVWAGKPAAVIGASVDTMGTVRAQEHLHQLMVDLQMREFKGPLINILSVETKSLPDYQAELQKFLKGFVEFIRN